MNSKRINGYFWSKVSEKWRKINIDEDEEKIKNIIEQELNSVKSYTNRVVDAVEYLIGDDEDELWD